MKFVDMFCGMGTIRMGFEQAGHECSYSVEWDKHKRKIYEVIFGHEPEASDIRAVRANDIPRSDCWCFGAPCQDFSIAGLRSGMQGDRSSLVREVFRLVRETAEEHRPEWLLYENVKGMLSSNKGLDYLEILFEMGSLGYDIEWQLLNSKDFGVPQNRERVYTIGHLRGRGFRKVFPIGGEGNQYNTVGKSTKTAVARTLTGGGHSGGNHSGMTVIQICNVMPTATRDNPNQGRVYDPDGLAPCLNKMEGGGREPMIVEPCGISFTSNKIIGEVDIANTLMARHPSTNLGNHQPITGVLSYDLKATPNSTRRGAVKTGYVGSLDTQCNVGVTVNNIEDWNSEKFAEMMTTPPNPSKYMPHNMRIRRLTPRECMRLQGVPDYITDKLISAGISDTQMYRAAGDACTVNVIYEIAKRMEGKY